jgi:vacuolar-type H+-ATPase subunit E/Vma4
MATPGTSDEQRFAAALLGRAEEDRRRLLREATLEAQEVQQEAEQQVARLRNDRLQAAERRAREHRDQQLSEIRKQQRADEARVFDEARARVMEAVRQDLASIRARPEYSACVGSMLDQAVAELGADTGLRLIIDRRDRECVAAIVRSRRLNAVDLIDGGPFLGGLQVSTRDGHSMIDHTFDARIFARQPWIQVELGRIFGRADQ